MTPDELREDRRNRTRSARRSIRITSASASPRAASLRGARPGARRHEKGSRRIGHGERSAGEGRGLHGPVQRPARWFPSRATARCTQRHAGRGPGGHSQPGYRRNDGLKRCPTNVPFLRAPEEDRAGKLRQDRSRAHRRLHRARRLRRPGHRHHRDDAAGSHRSRLCAAACAGAAARVIPPASSGAPWPRPASRKSTSSATPTKATPARSWTARVLESDPHRVLEGMAIAAYAVGAQKGYIYVRAEYPLAVKHLRPPSARPSAWACWATTSAASRFSFHVDIRLGAGAFVCGEETALIASIEGKRGTPRPRPPYPAAVGPVGLPHPHQQRRDLRQRGAHHPQRRRPGSPSSARKRARAPRSSPWPAGSPTPA